MGQACEALRRFVPQVAAQIRTAGIGIVQAQRAASDALQIAVNATQDPLAEWILAPHREAQNEVRWTGVIDGALTNVRVDRVFRAGLEPQSKGDSAWWIVDYKTAQSEEADSASVLARLRMLFAPQLEAYARVLRNLQGANAVVRAGLYYPRMRLFDWWVV
jgi:ATP-dependent helicase/nuclease subunit A